MARDTAAVLSYVLYVLYVLCAWWRRMWPSSSKGIRPRRQQDTYVSMKFTPMYSFFTRISPSFGSGTGRSVLNSSTSTPPVFSMTTPFMVRGIVAGAAIACAVVATAQNGRDGGMAEPGEAEGRME